METKKLKKLSLHKEIVSRNDELRDVQGGWTTTIGHTDCSKLGCCDSLIRCSNAPAGQCTGGKNSRVLVQTFCTNGENTGL